MKPIIALIQVLHKMLGTPVVFPLLLMAGMCSCSDKNKLIVNHGTMDASDFEICLFTSSTSHDPFIYKEGTYFDIPNEYGENDWVIKHKGLQCKFRHFKTNRRYSHKYMFTIYEKRDTLYCDIDIRGKNNMKTTLHFSPINQDDTEHNLFRPASSKPSKDNHRRTFALNDSLYVEMYQTYAGNDTTTGSYTYYITDSVHFRKYIGRDDHHHERIFWTAKNPNEVLIYLIRSKADPEALKKDILVMVKDTTMIRNYYIPDLIKGGKFEGRD